MARWICPNCRATMTVRPELIGKERACPKCGETAEIVDAGPSLDDAGPTFGQSTTPVQVATSKRTTQPFVKTVPVDVMAARIVALILLVIWLFGEFVEFNRIATTTRSTELTDELAGWCIGRSLIAFAAYFVVWYFFTLIEDTRANRIALEEINTRLKAGGK